MNPKEYAKFLIDSFNNVGDDMQISSNTSKDCALFTIEQLKKSNAKPQTNSHAWNKMEYWEQVEVEIISYKIT